MERPISDGLGILEPSASYMTELAAQIVQAEKELDEINPIAALVGLACIHYRGITLGVCPKGAIIGRYLKA